MADQQGEHLAAAVEAAARMLPASVTDGSAYEVARVALRVAVPHLVQHLGGRALEEVLGGLLALHTAGPADPDGLRVCEHDAYAWPCPSVRLAGVG